MDNILKWDKVLEEASYKKLSPLEKEMAQTQYFNEVVKPQVPQQDWGIAEKQFYSDFPSPIMQKAQGSWATPQTTTPNVNLQTVKPDSSIGDTFNRLTTPVPTVDIKAQISQSVSADDSAIGAAVKGIKEYWGMGVPVKSAFGLARGMVEFPYHVLQADMALRQGNVQPAADIIKGLIHFIGRPTGASDIAESLVNEGKLIPESFTQMGDAWISDPAGSLLAVAPFVKGGIKTIVDTGKKFKEGIKPDIKPTSPPLELPVKSLDQITVEVEGMRTKTGKIFKYKITAEEALKDPDYFSQRQEIVAQIKKQQPAFEDVNPVKSLAEQTIEAEQVKMREAQAQGVTREQQLKSSQVNAIKTGEAAELLLNGKSIKNHVLEGIESGLKPEVIENNVRELLTIQYAKEPNPLKQIEALKAQKQLNKDVSDAFYEKITKEQIQPIAKPEIAPAKAEVKPKPVETPKNIINWVISKGGINYEREQWKGELKDIRDSINAGKKIGKGNRVVRKNTGKTLDELALMAKDEGYIAKATPQALLDAMAGKKEHPIAQEEAIGAEMEKLNITTKQEGKTAVDPATLKEGDKVIVDNVEYTHKGKDAKDNIKLLNDYDIRLDAFDTLYVDRVIPKEEFKLTEKATKPETPKKPIPQELPLGAEKKALEGKMPSEPTPETPIEKAQKEAEIRKTVAEEEKAQLKIEEKPPKPPVTAPKPTEPSLEASIFKSKTDMSFYDEIIEQPDYVVSQREGNYWRNYKRFDWKSTSMKPDEYINIVAEVWAKNQNKPKSNILKEILETRSDIADLEAWVKAGNKLPTTVLDFGKDSFNQEGLHRAILAKKMGLDKIPVFLFSRDNIKLSEIPYLKNVEKAKAIQPEKPPTAQPEPPVKAERTKEAIQAKPRELHTFKVGEVVDINGKKVKIVSNIKDSFGEPQRVSVQPMNKVTKTIKDKTFQMPQKPYDISPFTEVYKEPLGGEGGYVRIAKDTPDLDIRAIKNMDIKPAEQMLTTLHVADRHPFMKAPIETAIKAVQDTNHIITQKLQNLTDIFDKAEGKPLWGLIKRRSSNIRDLDLMVEGKVKTPPQLQEFVTGVKGFLEEQRQRVIESKKQDIASHLSPKQQEYRKYLKEGGEIPKHTRPATIKAVQEVQKQMKDVEGWGKTDYFPRLMRGSYYFLGENGKILAIGETPKQAKYNLMERLESDPSLKGTRVYFTNGLKNMLNARHTLNPELRGTLEQLGTALSRKQFFNLINKTEKLIDAEIKEAGIGEIEGVKVDMRGIAKMQSREKFAGNLMKRNTGMRGQEADPFKTLSAYTSAIERHLGLSDAKKALINFEEKLPPNMENAKVYIKKLRENMLGHYDWANKFTDQVIGGKIGAKPFLLSRLMQKGQSAEANLKLGFAPVKALLNYTDAMLSTLTKTGVKHWANGVRLLGTKEGKTLIEEIGHLGGMEESFAYSYKTTPETVNILKPMGLYQFAELKGRSQSIAAAYSQGLEMYSGDIAKAKQHAVDIVRLTQGLYDVSARPVAIRNPLTSTAYQFKQFINNKIRFLASLSPRQIAFYAPSIITLYGTRGLWLTMKSIVGITLISDLIGNAGGKANEDMNKNYPRLHRGLFGLAGYDVSAPGTVQLPTQVRDWMGVIYNDTIKTGEMIIKGMKNNGWTDEEIAQYINQVAPVGYNIYKGLQLAQSGEIRQGEKLIYRGKPSESIYNFLGAKTVEQSKEQDTARYENELKKRQKEKMAVITDKILSSKTQEELNENIQDAIETKGIMTQDELNSFVGGLVKTWKANQLTARERTFQGLPKNIKREEFINEFSGNR